MKKCTKCKEEKDLSEFNKDKKNKDGHCSQCKKCRSKLRKEYDKQYSKNNKEKYKEWREKNKEYLKEYFKEYRKINIEKKKEYDKQYNKNNREKINEYRKNKIQTNPLFKLRKTISNSILQSIKNKGFTKRSQTYKILGCTYEEFKIYLENQFTKGMSWENQGEWHLDHIYPVSLAKDEEELIKLNHYTNFQPLWAEDNLKKSNKLIQKKRTD